MKIAISSRTLFDLAESHGIYENQGVRAYSQYQINEEDSVLAKGPAFHLIRKFLRLPGIEIILVSRNSADTGLRIFNSIQHYGLNITRAAFTSGAAPFPYLEAFGIDLFLSAHREDVCQVLQAGFAAATILSNPCEESELEELRIAFDGDAVIFSDEAETIYQAKGLPAFSKSEAKQANNPLPGGPFKPFLEKIHQIQKDQPGLIRTALITARSAPAHERVIKTLRAWDILIDEAVFLGGLTKAEFLKAFGADCFFDDQEGHCSLAANHVTTGHVPYGVINN